MFCERKKMVNVNFLDYGKSTERFRHKCKVGLLGLLGELQIFSNIFHAYHNVNDRRHTETVYCMLHDRLVKELDLLDFN